MTASAPTDSVDLEDLLKTIGSSILQNHSMTLLHGFHNREIKFSQNNLVSDSQEGHQPAQIQDDNLVNPWGIAFSPTSPFWVSDNHTGVATIYNVDPTTNTTTASSLVVTIAAPTGQSGPASPTGQVFNSDTNSKDFLVTENGASAKAVFIFDTEDGTISAWNPSVDATHSVIEVDNSSNSAHGDPNVPPDEGVGAVYKGLAVAQNDGQTMLYAANFRHGTVDVFDAQWNQVMSFTDPSIPQGYAPFNVQVLDGHLFVTFAEQDQFKHDDVAGKGHGFVDEFDLSGNLITRVSSHGQLDSPWGLAIAPSDFGQFAGDLLVGNFGDGTINAFNMKNDTFAGKLLGADGKPIQIGDLWALTPGNDTKAGSSGNIYFTAGIKDESQGLFGSITPIAGTNHFAVNGS